MPDVYQGTELFEYSLVDPDNRRPVDWDQRRALLARLDDATGCPTWTPPGRRSCWSRRARCGCGATGPRRSPATARCLADGAAAEHAVAFTRSPSLVAVATRLPVGLAARGGWGDTVLPLPDGAADWYDVVAGEPVDGSAPRLGSLLRRYPVALLVRPT